MKTRIIAMVLCVLMLIPLFSSCSKVVVESYVQMYLSHQVYDLDPLNAYTNDAQLKVISLVFAGLFKIDEKGNVTNDLVKKVEVINKEDKQEYTIRLTLKDTCWSDGSAVSSDDVVYTFKRVLKAQNSNDAAAMLMKIKNAATVKSGDDSIDDLGITAPQTNVVEIQFNETVTDELLAEFRLALTSPALFPLRESHVQGKTDWAKKPSSMVFSGPFIVRKVSYENGKRQITLERNEYYMRNREKDAVDKYVTPYRIVIDFEYAAEDQMTLYENGQVLFVSEIPLAKRAEYQSKATVTDSLSTHTYYFNQNAVVYSKGYAEKLTEYFGGYESTFKSKYEPALAAWNTWKKANSSDVTIEFPSFPHAPTTVLNAYADDAIAAFIEAQAEYKTLVAEFKANYTELSLPKEAMPPEITALEKDEGQVKLFAIPEIRRALSIVIDREAIASAAVFAKPATGLLSNRVFDGVNAKTTFRSAGESVLSATSNSAEAQSLISAANINPSDYSFSIRVRACDEVHKMIAEAVAASWNSLGFNVTVEPIDIIVNNDIDPSTKEEVTDIRDDIFDEEVVLGGNYQVMAIDLVPKSPDAFSVLAPYAIDFTGNRTVTGAVKVQTPNMTGYNSEAYNELINKAFAAATSQERSQYLHEAEKLLVATDAAVMPVVFNQNAVLKADSISGLKQSYYGFWYLAGMKFKEWADYREVYFPETTEGEQEETPTDEPV